MGESKYLPAHITEADIETITKVITPVIVAAAYRDAAQKLADAGQYRGLYFGINWLRNEADRIERRK